jgi:hypothetical protein
MRTLRELVLIQRFIDLLIDWHAIDSPILSTFTAEPLVRSNVHLSLIGLRLRRIIVDKLILIQLGGTDISIYCFSKIVYVNK